MDEFRLRFDSIKVGFKQSRVLGEKGFGFDTELDTGPSLFEVEKREGVVGLVEDFADNSRAETPFSIIENCLVELRIFAPYDLETGNGGALEEEPKAGVLGNWG